MSEPQTYQQYMERAKRMARDVDLAVLCCRPKEPVDFEREMAEQVGMDIDTPYEDSTESTCQLCDRVVWLGPRQRTVLLEQPSDKTVVLCLTCTVTLQAAGIAPPEETPIVSLGSDHPTDRPHG